MTQFTVFLLATHWTPTLDNSLATLRKHNFPFTLLAKGETWKGWKWRTQQYLRAAENACDNEILIFLDAFDTLCQKDSCDFITNFQAFNADIVLGCEWYCGNSSNCGNVDAWWSHHSFTSTPMRKYVNAGCVIGRARALRKMYRSMLMNDIDDDQLALAEWVNNNPDSCALDYGSAMVYNAHILDLQKTPVMPYFLHYPGPLFKHKMFPRYNKDLKDILGTRGKFIHCSEWITLLFYLAMLMLSLLLLYKLV